MVSEINIMKVELQLSLSLFSLSYCIEDILSHIVEVVSSTGCRTP